MLAILILLYLRIYIVCEGVLVKYAGKMFYIYLAIIAINSFINILLLIVDTDSITNLINTMEIGNEKFILKIQEGKENTDLVQSQDESVTKSVESKKKIDSVDENQEDKCKGKNLNPLCDIHKRLLSADKSHFPSYFQKNSLPKFPEDVPPYSNKLVYFKSSSLLQDRNLPSMFIDIPKSTSIGKLTELHKAINGADEAVKLYDSQFVKFNNVLSSIKNGTEDFYPNEAKPLMETYVDLVTKLSNQQKIMANEAISQLHKLDSSFSRDLYTVNHNGDVQGTGTVSVSVPGTGTDIGASTGTGAGTRADIGKIIGTASIDKGSLPGMKR